MTRRHEKDRIKSTLDWIERNALDLSSFTSEDLLATISSLRGLDGHFELLKWLLHEIEAKEWCNARDSDGCTALHTVMYGPSSDAQSHFLVEAFIRMGVDPTVKSRFGSVLTSFITRAFPDHLRTCLNLGMDINEATDSDKDKIECFIRQVKRKRRDGEPSTIDDVAKTVEQFNGQPNTEQIQSFIAHMETGSNSETIPWMIKCLQTMQVTGLSSTSPAFTTMLERFAESKSPETIERCVQVAKCLVNAKYDFGAQDRLGNRCYDAIRHFGWSEILQEILDLDGCDSEHRHWCEPEWTSESRVWESGFEPDSTLRWRRPFVPVDVVMHSLMVTLRAERYNKDPTVVSTLKERIRSVFSTLSNEYTASIHSTLHNHNSSMYGYLYLDDVRSHIDA